MTPETSTRTISRFGVGLDVVADHRDVRDDDARLGEQTQLERELVRVPELLEERLLPERFWDDDGDEVGLTARQPPDLLEHRVRHATRGIERLERRRCRRCG